MKEELAPITFNKIVQAEKYTMFLLGTKEKHFPIYTDAKVGENISHLISGQKFERPKTHDFIATIFKGLDISLLQVVLHDVENNIFFAKVFLKQSGESQQKILEIDARPSDALTMALMYDVPIYCTKALLEKVPHADM